MSLFRHRLILTLWIIFCNMKKKYIFAISIVIVLVLPLALYWFPRLFGSTETKAFYAMRNTLQSYINPKADNLIDFIHQSLTMGGYSVEDNNEKYYMYVKTDDEYTDVISDIYLLNDEIREYVSSNQVVFNQNTEIEICIENWSFWIIRLYPMSNRIALGLNSDIPITEALDYLKNFQNVSVGGYWGYNVPIPDDFDSSYLESFDNLKTLEITDVENDEELREKLSGLNEIKITIEYVEQ